MADKVQLSRADKPARKFFENPITWWKGASYGWNTDVTIWTGTGEAEALCELFFDNLATLLGVTGSAVGHIGYGIIGNSDLNGVPGYGLAVAQAWEKIYFNRAIPGCAFALLFGNLFYAYQCGRLGSKEGRNDVTAQPYGMNTTGIYITLYAIQLEALFTGGFKYIDQAAGGDVEGAALAAAEYAWKVGVSANLIMGLFEMLGGVLGEAIRKVTPTAAFYSPLLGVGFVWLAFSPMLKIAQEPMMCLIPILIVMVGFFGGVRFTIYKKLSLPIALTAILYATAAGWGGACKRKAGSVGAINYGYDLPFGSESNYEYVTCRGTSITSAEGAYEQFAWSSDILKDSIFVGLGGMGDIGDYISTIFLVAAVGFTGTMACVESASAAGDDYPMTETMLADGMGTAFGALFGSIYSTTVYIGHPIHKALGAKRGYSLFNGLIYFALLLSGLFASLYNVIPECANGAILLFVGLLLGRQAFEESPSKHYPALLLSIFPYICNWAKLSMPDEGVQMMGQAGGTLFSFVLAWMFCLCIDRKFLDATVLSFLAIWLSLFGFFASHNMANDEVPPTEGNEKIGFYGKEDHDYNNGWRWAVSWSLACVFFALHALLQKFDLVEKPDVADGEKEDEAPAINNGEDKVDSL